MRAILKLNFWIILVAVIVTSCRGTVSLNSVEELPVAIQQNKIIDVSAHLLERTLKNLKDKTVVVEFSTTWCEVCKAIYEPLQKLATKSKGRYVIIRVDVTQEFEPLFRHDMKPAFPGFLVLSPELKAPLRKYGSNAMIDLNKWLPADDSRPKVSPLAFNSVESKVPPKAVLVAGSGENANFAQEIILMRALLIERGMRAEDIECFYANADPLAYFADQEQFDELKEELANCHQANRVEILRTIQRGLVANPANFFLYASSHGHGPGEAPKLEKGERDCSERAPSLVLDGGDNKCQALNHLTPESIASIVPHDNATAKTFIFQGCFTGGFISNTDNPKKNPSELAKLPHMTLLTASRSDRASFGCDTGNLTTVFGASILKAMANTKGEIKDMPWPSVFENAEQDVRQAERRLGFRERSEPQFYQK